MKASYYLLRPFAAFATWPTDGGMPESAGRALAHFRREIERGKRYAVACSRDGGITVCLPLRDIGFLLAETGEDEVSPYLHKTNGSEAVFSLWLDGGLLLDD